MLKAMRSRLSNDGDRKPGFSDGQRRETARRMADRAGFHPRFFHDFWIAGLAVAALLGGITENGFNLNSPPALLCFALMIAYFVMFNRYLGGNIGKRILKAKTHMPLSASPSGMT